MISHLLLSFTQHHPTFLPKLSGSTFGFGWRGGEGKKRKTVEPEGLERKGEGRWSGRALSRRGAREVGGLKGADGMTHSALPFKYLPSRGNGVIGAQPHHSMR